MGEKEKRSDGAKDHGGLVTAKPDPAPPPMTKAATRAVVGLSRNASSDTKFQTAQTCPRFHAEYYYGVLNQKDCI